MRRFWNIAGISLLLLWTAYWTAGQHAAHVVANKIGPILVRVAEGKFNNSSLFIQNRFRDVLWLLTVTVIWGVLQSGFNYFVAGDRCSPRWRWVWRSLAGFVFLNIWVALAANTALFWAVLGAGAGGNNYMQFQFKRQIAGEIRAPARAVLVGSSQTRTQIDENLLNARLGQKLWTTELHYPGSKANDLLILEPQLALARPDLVICYFNESYLYSGPHSEIPPTFLKFSQLPDLKKSGALHYLSADEISYGLVGDALPLFRCRSVISQRLLGQTLINLPQARYDAGLEVDLDARGREAGSNLRRDDASEFQKRAMEMFVERCNQAGRRLVLLIGGSNPLWERHTDPAVRVEMMKYLDGLKARYPNLVIIPETEFPQRKPSDYEDLTHVNRTAQQQYTERLTEVLLKFGLVK